jgi:hypothetical protein
MNSILESIEFASDSYWGDKERFQFRASITQFPTPVEVINGNDRAIKSELNLTLNGYIIPKTINVHQAAPSPKSYNVTKFIWEERIVEGGLTSRTLPKTIEIPKTPFCVKSIFKKFISGTENIIYISEHNISNISSIEVYDSSDNKVGVQIVKEGTTVSILTNTPLNNHLLIIS